MSLQYLRPWETVTTFTVGTFKKKQLREEGVEPTVQWSCKETTVKGEPGYGKCVEAVIRETYTADEEFAMINKYNAYKAGIITDESIVEEYEGYLREVVSIKERVKRDLASYV